MAYTTPDTVSNGQVHTSTRWNTQVRDNFEFLHEKPVAKVSRTGSVSISNNTVTQVLFGTSGAQEDYDTDGMHDPSTNSSRLTCVTAGLYTVSANFEWDTNTTGFREGFIGLNGSGTRLTDVIQDGLGSAGHSRGNMSVPVELAVNDYVELFVYQNSGGNLSIIAGVTWLAATFERGPIS